MFTGPGSGVVAGVRHHLRRGPAPVRRVAVGLRPPVPRPDGQARRRLHRGLSPAISIDQKSASRNPRSTVGTITEVYDYLRLLFARIGVAHCPECGAEVTRQTAADRRPHHGAARRHPVPGAGPWRGRKGTYETLLADLAARASPAPGRRRGAGDVREGRAGPLRAAHHRGDRRPPRAARRHRAPADRLAGDGVLKLADGVAEVQIVPRNGDGADRVPGGKESDRRGEDEDNGGPETLTFSQHLACPNGHGSFEELAPRNFSFNSPLQGLRGVRRAGHPLRGRPRADRARPRPQPEGRAIAPWSGRPPALLPAAGGGGRRGGGHRHDAPFGSLAAKQRQAVLYGKGVDRVWVKFKNRYGRERTYHANYEGVIPVPAAAPLRRRVRQRPRAGRGLHARGAVRGLRWSGSSRSRWP